MRRMLSFLAVAFVGAAVLPAVAQSAPLSGGGGALDVVLSLDG